MIECLDCNGKGEMIVGFNESYFDYPKEIYATCSNCHGEGEILSFACEQCEEEKPIKFKVEIKNPFTGKIDETICENCNEENAQKALEQ